MKAYSYKLYNDKHNAMLHDMCRASAFVWNHCLALQKRYHTLYGGYVSSAKMQSHFAKKVKSKHSFLANLGSQSVQEVIQRLDASYSRFFKKTQKRPPKFKPARTFSSFVFKQAGYKLEGNSIYISKLKKTFRFFLSRPYWDARTVRLKRDRLGDFYIIITSEVVNSTENDKYGKTHDGAAVGIDFGLKTFLTLSNGEKITSPLFFKKDMGRIKKLHHNLSKKLRRPTGQQRFSKKYNKMVNVTELSNHGQECRKALCRAYNDITNRREDFFYKLAHELCQRYDYIFLETLNIKAMHRLWGRKVSDLSHASFVVILKEVAMKYGVVVHQIDKWYPSSKTCSECGYIKKDLTLADREYVCPECGCIHDRDINAAINIKRKGISEYLSGCKTEDSLEFEAAMLQER